MSRPQTIGVSVGRPHEIEVKLELDAPEVAALQTRITSKLGAAVRTQHLVSVYYDTHKQALRKHGLTCRVRTVEGRHVQTVKSAAQSNGLYQRAEWEGDIAGELPGPGCAG